MKNLLFIYNNPLDGSYGGSQRTKQAIQGLSRHFNVLSYSCIKKSNPIATMCRNLCGYSGNLSARDCKLILHTIAKEKIDVVFFDVSLHGRLVLEIKQLFPDVNVVVNYHNCEAKYFGDMFKTKGIAYYPIYHSAEINELLSKKHADFHIFITEEDRKQLGVENNYCVIPVTLEDSYKELTREKTADPYLLFVGAAQYANIEGAKYIIENLAPNSERKFLIVGKGMKLVFPGVYKNVEVRDFVPSLLNVYRDASAFICPLFFGSGAKVKVAEALMYGKKIIGTPLSFFGYELTGCSYSVCNSEREFLDEINQVDMDKRFYKENRQVFLEKYDACNNGEYYSTINKFFFSVGWNNNV